MAKKASASSGVPGTIFTPALASRQADVGTGVKCPNEVRQPLRD